MGFLAKTASVAAPARVRASDGYAGAPAGNGFFYMPSARMLSGMDGMSPELALTLSHVYSAVDIISGDFGTMPVSLFQDLEEDGKQRVRFSDAGIGALAYRLRWQPNSWQSGKAFWSTLAWQYMLRPACYAEIYYRPGSDSLIDQIVPRHPDRVRQIRLPSGALAFALSGEPGGTRYVTEAEMFVARNTSTDGLNALGRIDYGAKTLSMALTLQQFSDRFFKKGITGALLATYTGTDMGDEEEDALHNSITRFVGGAENAGGVMLVPEDIKVSALGVDPEKAQLLGLKELSGRDVARLFKLPPYKLAIAGTMTYASQVQSAQDYVNTCQMPLIREFQDAIFLHLIVGRNYYAKFNSRHLVMADLKTMMEAFEIGIRARVWRPSEAREMLDMSPDEELDRLSAMDHRAGAQRDGQQHGNDNAANGRRAASVKHTLVMHDAATRVLRRERVAVEKIAKTHPTAEKHEGWRTELRAFYADHARFVADTMRVPDGVARAFCASHGALIEDKGLGPMTDHWMRLEAESLVELALEPEAVGRLVLSEGVPHAA